MRKFSVLHKTIEILFLIFLPFILSEITMEAESVLQTFQFQGQKQLTSPVPLTEGNVWVYDYYRYNHSVNNFVKEATIIKIADSDTVINTLDFKQINVHFIKNISDSLSFEFWRVDSGKYFLDESFEFIGYDTSIHSFTLFIGDSTTYWWEIEVRTGSYSFYNMSYTFQDWLYILPTPGVFSYVKQWKTACGLGIVHYFHGYITEYMQNYDHEYYTITGVFLDTLSLGQPPPPLHLDAVPDTHFVSLSWSTCLFPDVAGYRIYSGDDQDMLTLSDSTTNIEDTTLIIDDLESDKDYYFAVTSVDSAKRESNFSVIVKVSTLGSPHSVHESNANILPDKIKLYPNHPNPFNARTMLSYYLPEPGEITLNLYDLNGRFVDSIDRGYRDKGLHIVEINGSGLSSGVYIYILKQENKQVRGKCIILK